MLLSTVPGTLTILHDLQVTVASWVKITNPPPANEEEMTVADKSGQFQKEWRLSIVATAASDDDGLRAKVRFGSNTNSSEGWAVAYSLSLPHARLGEWFHVAMAWNGTHIEVLCDGITVNTREWAGTIESSGADVRVGAAPTWGQIDGRGNESLGYFMSGLIDELQIWKQSRTRSDLGWQDLNGYSFQHTPATPRSENDLVAYWNFNEGRGAMARDVVGSVSFLFGILRPSAVASPRWSIDSPERLNGVIKTVESTSVVFALEAYDASRRHLQVNIAFNASPHPLFFSCVLGNSHTSFFLNCSL